MNERLFISSHRNAASAAGIEPATSSLTTQRIATTLPRQIEHKCAEKDAPCEDNKNAALLSRGVDERNYVKPNCGTAFSVSLCQASVMHVRQKNILFISEHVWEMYGVSS